MFWKFRMMKHVIKGFSDIIDWRSFHIQSILPHCLNKTLYLENGSSATELSKRYFISWRLWLCLASKRRKTPTHDMTVCSRKCKIPRVSCLASLLSCFSCVESPWHPTEWKCDVITFGTVLPRYAVSKGLQWVEPAAWRLETGACWIQG